MVFTKNIMNKALKILIFIFFSSSLLNCSYNYTENSQEKNPNINKIKINANTLILTKNSNIKKNYNDENISYINQTLINEFEKWASQKFVLFKGKHEANIIIHQAEAKLSQILKKKGLKAIFLHKEEKTFKIDLFFTIVFKENDKKNKRLKINANIDLTLFDNLSISKRNSVIEEKVSKLIMMVDSKINNDFKNEIFSDNVTN